MTWYKITAPLNITHRTRCALGYENCWKGRLANKKEEGNWIRGCKSRSGALAGGQSCRVEFVLGAP